MRPTPSLHPRWPVAWLRALRPGRNPLLRRCDRVETAILAGLLAALLIGGPLAAVFGGRWAYDAALRMRQAELASSHRVSAVLLTPAAWQGAEMVVSAQARWTGPGGAQRTGEVFPPAGSSAGTTVQIWVTRAGRLTEPPLQPAQVTGQGVLAAVTAAIVLAALLGSAGLVTRRLADRRRMASWDAEWRATAPRWSQYR